MRNHLVVLSAIILISCSRDAGLRFENLTLSQALEKARDENKQVLLDFYSPT
jgi:hypothetical protein